MDDQPNSPEPPYASVLRKIGAGVLVVGLALAAVVYVTAPPPEADDYGGAHVSVMTDSKQYELELERIGGKAAVVAAEINDWLGSLWHGRRLAGTIAAISVVVSMLCFFAADVPPED